MDLIDFETEHKNYLRNEEMTLNPATYHLVKDEYEADINRVWKFLAENVILPAGNILNKH